MGQATIRSATAADAVLLAELAARTFYDTYAADNTAENINAYLSHAFGPAQQAAELADPSCLFLIAEVADTAAGYAQLQISDPPLEIVGAKPIELARIYTAQHWIGRGIGGALMQACLDEAQKQGREMIWLGVWERNSRARAFYRKWGFVEVGTHIFQLGDDPQTDMLMQRAVTG